MKADIATASAEAAAAAGVTIAVFGTLLGMPLDSILVGFLGALIAQTWVPMVLPAGLTRLQSYVRSFGQLLAAGLLAGIGTPLVEAILAGALPMKVPAEAAHLAAAGLIGILAPIIVPGLRHLFRKWSEK